MPAYREKTERRSVLKEPPLYRVIVHNDDYTTMEFVIEVLQRVFHKRQNEAEEIMWRIHEKGKAMCGIYTREIAATKAEQVKQLARQNSFPLLATIEKEE